MRIVGKANVETGGDEDKMDPSKMPVLDKHRQVTLTVPLLL